MSEVSNYVVLQLGDEDEAYIEVVEREDDCHYDSPKGKTKLQNLTQEQFENMLKASSKVIERFKEFHADEMEIEFNMKLNADAKLVFAEAGLEGQFGVKLIWKDKKTENINGGDK